MNDIPVYAALLISCVLLGFVAGRIEPISFYRFSSFMFGPMLALAITLIAYAGACLPLTPQKPLFTAALCLPLLLMALTAQISYSGTLNKRDAIINGFKFASGIHSIDDAYSYQPNAPFSGIYPATREIYRIVGPGTPIWTFHVWSYCMLPECEMQSFISFHFSDQMDKIFTSTPEDIRTILHTEHHDYFMISADMKITDLLPLSPMFAPDNIARNLAVRWTDGNTVLLTWPGPQTTPVSPQWLAHYRAQVEDLQNFSGRMYLPQILDYMQKAQRSPGPFPPPLQWY